MNKKGDVGSGIYILLMVFIALIVLTGLAPSTSSLFQALGEGKNGFVGFIISNFNGVLLFALTILGFIGIKVLASG